MALLALRYFGARFLFPLLLEPRSPLEAVYFTSLLAIRCADTPATTNPTPKRQTVTTVFTRYDKAGAAAIGAAIGTAIAHFYPMDMEMQGAITLLLSTVLTWLIPNKET